MACCRSRRRTKQPRLEGPSAAEVFRHLMLLDLYRYAVQALNFFPGKPLLALLPRRATGCRSFQYLRTGLLLLLLNVAREEVMTDNPLEIPQALRDVSEQNLQQAHAAYKQLMDFVSKTMNAWMEARRPKMP